MAEGGAAQCKSGLLWLRHGSKPWRSSALYFVCDGAKLSYFTHKPTDSAEIPNCIVRYLDAADTLSDAPVPVKAGGHTFDMRVEGAETYTFKADTEQEAQEVRACACNVPVSYAHVHTSRRSLCSLA